MPEIVPYRNRSTDPWTNCANEPDGEWTTVTGTCAACGHETDFSFTETIVAGVAPPVPVEEGVTVTCDCGYTHEGRPDDTYFKGCGAYWYGSDEDGR